MAGALKTAKELYAAFDPEDLYAEDVTLCADCAKHPSLKRFISENSIEGPVCGVCQEIGYVYPACNPSRKHDLRNLIRALVRLYYNEHEYNSHWGGDEPETLLIKDNPIIEDKPTQGRDRSPDKSIDFFESIFSENPYPPVDEGISIYAGHDEEMRGMNFALKDRQNFKLNSYIKRLTTENHFDIEPDLLELTDKYASRITSIIPNGTRYFRVRIGVEATFYDDDNIGWSRPIVRQPFQGPKLGAPPPPIATAGRLNRAGTSFLYLASDAETAAAEVRPHPGHFLSVGEFESQRAIKIASFEADIRDFSGNEYDLDLFHFIYSTDQLMGMPVIPEQARRYSITQLIAECLRQKGFDGVSFKSSVGRGRNLCVFRPELFSPVEGSATVQKVTALKYETEGSASILVPSKHHYRV